MDDLDKTNPHAGEANNPAPSSQQADARQAAIELRRRVCHDEPDTVKKWMLTYGGLTEDEYVSLVKTKGIEFVHSMYAEGTIPFDPEDPNEGLPV